MLRRVFGPAMLAALIVAVPAFTADDPKTKSDGSSLKPFSSDKLPLGEHVGILDTVPGAEGNFTLRFDKSVPEKPEVLALKIQEAKGKIAGIQSKLAGAKTAQAQQQLQLQLQGANAQLQLVIADAKMKTESKFYDMKLTDTADIRNNNLPVFDDMGKAIKYTPKEKEEARGKKLNLPGYEAKLDDLKVGQTIKVRLTNVYTKKDTTKKVDTKADDAVKDAKEKPATEMKTQVSMILILKEPVDKDDSKDTKKKKKNN